MSIIDLHLQKILLMNELHKDKEKLSGLLASGNGLPQGTGGLPHGLGTGVPRNKKSNLPDGGFSKHHPIVRDIAQDDTYDDDIIDKNVENFRQRVDEYVKLDGEVVNLFREIQDEQTRLEQLENTQIKQKDQKQRKKNEQRIKKLEGSISTKAKIYREKQDLKDGHNLYLAQHKNKTLNAGSYIDMSKLTSAQASLVKGNLIGGDPAKIGRNQAVVILSDDAKTPYDGIMVAPSKSVLASEMGMSKYKLWKNFKPKGEWDYIEHEGHKLFVVNPSTAKRMRKRLG